MKLPASFRLTTSCTFLLEVHLLNRQSFCFFSTKGSMAFSFLQSILQNSQVKLAGLSQGRRGGLRTALVRTAPQGCPEADREMASVGPLWSLPRTSGTRVLTLRLGSTSLTRGPLPGGMCQCFQPSWLQKSPLDKRRTHTSSSKTK